MAELTLNFGFVSDNQLQSSSQRRIEATTNTFARLIVRNVAISVASRARTQARHALIARVRAAVDDEIDHMAMTIGNALTTSQSAKGPRGQMSIHGGMSFTAEGRGWAPTFNRADTGITWDQRNPRYVRRKVRNGRSSDWWSYDGDLRSYLSKPGTYTTNFGKVRVTFDAPRNQAAALAKAGSDLSLTATGLTGPVREEINIGTIRVSALGDITPDDLPSLRTENVENATPHGLGLTRHIFEHDKGEAIKLARGAYKTGRQRYVIEPFVSFYLTRAIPNAVWRRLEQEPIITGGTRSAGSTGKKSALGREFG